jgi:hypothetical protein
MAWHRRLMPRVLCCLSDSSADFNDSLKGASFCSYSQKQRQNMETHVFASHECKANTKYVNSIFATACGFECDLRSTSFGTLTASLRGGEVPWLAIALKILDSRSQSHRV